ncbi:hypothetical protein DB43_HJ00240 [Parachlamydia acanthamoebae]|uniref:Uncharacterized protein n=1 Tax=Parachlamydia acanthamoebae TaxID=83552 RepID=A0A0C1E9P4_9BACT|nr:hypothetical protein DB43_HJ00240 [Parachlamydia acanthamoebae]
MCLSAAHVSDSPAPRYPEKLYFDSHDVEITDNAIYIHLENNLIETNVIRTDQQGFYIFENDITNYEVVGGIEKKWKCPHCYHWWPVGQKCKNTECPTNKW